MKYIWVFITLILVNLVSTSLQAEARSSKHGRLSRQTKGGEQQKIEDSKPEDQKPILTDTPGLELEQVTEKPSKTDQVQETPSPVAPVPPETLVESKPAADPKPPVDPKPPADPKPPVDPKPSVDPKPTSPENPPKKPMNESEAQIQPGMQYPSPKEPRTDLQLPSGGYSSNSQSPSSGFPSNLPPLSSDGSPSNQHSPAGGYSSNPQSPSPPGGYGYPSQEVSGGYPDSMPSAEYGAPPPSQYEHTVSKGEWEYSNPDVQYGFYDMQKSSRYNKEVGAGWSRRSKPKSKNKSSSRYNSLSGGKQRSGWPSKKQGYGHSSNSGDENVYEIIHHWYEQAPVSKSHYSVGHNSPKFEESSEENSEEEEWESNQGQGQTYEKSYYAPTRSQQSDWNVNENKLGYNGGSFKSNENYGYPESQDEQYSNYLPQGQGHGQNQNYRSKSQESYQSWPQSFENIERNPGYLHTQGNNAYGYGHGQNSYSGYENQRPISRPEPPVQNYGGRSQFQSYGQSNTYNHIPNAQYGRTNENDVESNFWAYPSPSPSEWSAPEPPSGWVSQAPRQQPNKNTRGFGGSLKSLLPSMGSILFENLGNFW